MSHRVATAEELLRDIATDLIRVPTVDEGARKLHLKALALKRVVMGWARQAPPEENVEAMLDTLRALRIEVLQLRSTSQVRLRSTHGHAAPGSATPAFPTPGFATIEAEFRRRAKG